MYISGSLVIHSEKLNEGKVFHNSGAMEANYLPLFKRILIEKL